jgi:SMC interacting uncharacterized protein involved in chromosome segregation
MNIFRKITEKLNPKIKKKSSVFDDSIESLEEIQAFVYKDLDLLKKKSEQFSLMKNYDQPLSAEALEKIKQNKIELSRLLDEMIRDKKSLEERIYKMNLNDPEFVRVRKLQDKFKNTSPIPRHPFTPGTSSETAPEDTE